MVYKPTHALFGFRARTLAWGWEFFRVTFHDSSAGYRGLFNEL